MLLATLLTIAVSLHPDTGRVSDSTSKNWNAAVEAEVDHPASSAPEWSNWLWYGASVGYRATPGSISVEGFRSRRVGLWDGGAIADSYFRTWRSAYANVRVQLAPGAHVLPGSDVLAELYQGLGDGWEATAGARRMNYRANATTSVDAGIGRYVGANYLHVRATALVPRHGANAASFGVVARHYGASTDDLIEAGASAGREVVNIGAGQAIDVRRASSAYLRGQWYFDPRFGAQAVVLHDAAQRIPTRTGVRVSLITRW